MGKKRRAEGKQRRHNRMEKKRREEIGEKKKIKGRGK